ncbi:hypothetical protein [Flavobacterium sp. 25HG05S-40]|uniref:hypothetical protein n=1 Tax=Flavobacterium sp. 25HG05S-40 TaxID=3458682 RepID=UPI004043AC45
MTNINQNFDITVWYRFVVAGEQEKDFDTHSISAPNVQEAVNKASDLYNSHKAIPFSYEYQGQKYSPTNFTKEDLFNLTQPDQCLQLSN